MTVFKELKTLDFQAKPCIINQHERREV